MSLREIETLEDIYDSYVERGLTDGLPIVPPTPERVQAMIDYSGRDPGEQLGIIPPTGCKPLSRRPLSTP